MIGMKMFFKVLVHIHCRKKKLGFHELVKTGASKVVRMSVANASLCQLFFASWWVGPVRKMWVITPCSQVILAYFEWMIVVCTVSDFGMCFTCVLFRESFSKYFKSLKMNKKWMRYNYSKFWWLKFTEEI